MNFKRFLSKMAIALLCMGSFTAQMPAMQAPLVQQEMDGACIGCNKWQKNLKNLPCEHPLCQACDEQITDDCNNLGLPGFCPSCKKVYITGDVIANGHGQPVNKMLFNPMLEPVTTQEKLFCCGTGIGITLLSTFFIKDGWDSADYGYIHNIAYSIGGLALIPLLEACCKLKNINKTLKDATHLSQSAPHLSTIIEKRAKAFRNKYLLYSLANSAITYGFIAFPYLLKAKMPRTSIVSILVAGGLYGGATGYIDTWGSKYESIPKLK